MDTQSPALTDVPNFKLAKVGKDRDRKRAGASWFGARGAGSGFTGAVGGSGGGAGLAGLLSAKTLMILAVAAISSSGAWMLGQHSSGVRAQNRPKAAEKKLFSDKSAQQYADTSNVIKADNSIPNSMGYVSGSLDGMTPEERAKKQAEDEAARAAEEAAAKKAADEEAKKADASEPASSAPLDPATIASTVGGGKKGLSEGKFGKLGSFGGGGGLSGGAGLSGGINRNFGGSSVDTKPKINAGSMSAFHNARKPGYSTGGHKLAGKSKAKGFAKRQLDNAFGQSRQAMAASKTENASAGAASPFDNNPAGGTVIEGPGVGAGVQHGGVDSGANPMASNSGGPLESGAACSAGQAPDINGVCQTIQEHKSKDDAPYQWMIDLAKGLMLLVSILAAIAMIAQKTVYGDFIKEYLSAIMIGIGVIEMGLGAAIMAMSGDKVAGGIVVAVGALTAATALIPDKLGGVQQGEMAKMAAGALIANALGAMGMMATGGSKAKAAMQ